MYYFLVFLYHTGCNTESIEFTDELKCIESDNKFKNITLEKTKMPTVFQVLFDSKEEGNGSVVFSSDGGVTYQVSPNGDWSDSHSQTLFGITENSDISYRVKLETKDQTYCSNLYNTKSGSFNG